MINVTNPEQFIADLNSLLSATRSKSVKDGLIAGATLINSTAKSKLQANNKGTGRSGGSYYATAFKMEMMVGRTPDEIGIKLGVSDKKNGYKLRWLEWGTAQRKTHQRKNAISKTVTAPMNRGRVQPGRSYFYSSVRNNENAVFNAVSEAIIKSLQDLSK